MPYIAPDLRELVDPALLPVLERARRCTDGELNYIITRILVEHLGPSPKYSDISRAVGTLECAKFELYRRVAAPYEDKKAESNGDVYVRGEDKVTDHAYSRGIGGLCGYNVKYDYRTGGACGLPKERHKQ